MWKSVKEKPPYGKHYLMFYDSGNMQVLFFWACSWENLTRPLMNGDRVTHWRELPEEPTEE